MDVFSDCPCNLGVQIVNVAQRNHTLPVSTDDIYSGSACSRVPLILDIEINWVKFVNIPIQKLNHRHLQRLCKKAMQSMWVTTHDCFVKILITCY